MKYEKLSAEDKKIIKFQLGKYSSNVIGVVKRCSKNAPVVIINHPVVKNGGYSLFPAVFWITCPNFKKSISKLESEGWLKKIKYAAEKDMDFIDTLKTAHEEYSYLRMSLLSSEEYSFLAEKHSNLLDDLKSCGVGSTKNMEIINCLHSHFAHYAATNINPVGSLVQTLLLELFEGGEYCRNCKGAV